jgi:hypothetical protein
MKKGKNGLASAGEKEDTQQGLWRSKALGQRGDDSNM